MMKAAYIESVGPPENIRFGDLPKPQVTGAQVLVRVHAVSVNPVDTYIRSGLVPMPLPFPFIVGCDLAGVVEAVGPEARRFRPGDRVWGSNQGLLGRQGTFAEYAAVHEEFLYLLPASVKFETAAALALVGITAHLGLFRDAKLQRGETVFVHGGTGGVGSAVIQMAKAEGARVITTAGNPEKVALAHKLGAALTINYRTQDVEAEIRKFAPGGVQVWFETLREPDFDKTVRCLAPRGRMVLMAGREARPPFPVGPFYVKGCSLHGFAMFQATPQEQRHCAEDMSRWMAQGKLLSRIGRILPLAEAAAAHRLQEENTIHQAGTLAGKIVLKP